MLRSLIALTAAAALAAPAQAADRPAPWLAARHGASPGIRVWISGGDLFRRGERVRVYFRTEADAYVALVRIDTDGRLRLLFPRFSSEDNYVAGGTTYQVQHADAEFAFAVDDDPGVGFIFAVAAAEPFDYEALQFSGRWDERLVSDGRVHSDPRSTLEEMVTELLPPGYTDFDTHLVPYHVGVRRYQYPRFVCYDCHAYVPYSYWDPYGHWCSRFTLVLWSDPWYYYPSYWYPTRYYGGTRVVYITPGSRSIYVFKARGASQPGIDYRDRRYEPAGPMAGDGGRRRAADVTPVRAGDIGGYGTVPAPRQPSDYSPARRTVSGGGGTVGGSEAPERQQPSARPADTGRRRGEIETPQAPARAQPRSAEPARRGSASRPPDAGAERSGLRRVEPSQPSYGGGPEQAIKPVPRQDAPRVDPSAGGSERRPVPQAPRAQPSATPRGEPRAAPAPRAEPRSGGGSAPRAEPRASAPRSSPEASAPRSSPPSPGLVRRRGD
jgi:hypothetical protein